MKINLAKSSGFCFGVRRALEVASRTIDSHQNVYMLGDIVHNEDVVRKIKQDGIKKIKKLTQGENRTLLIRAHGVSVKTLTKAKSLGYRIVDATCPMVKEIHNIAKKWKQKHYKIIIIGDKKHDEVQGIIGQLKGKAIVIDSRKRIPHKALSKIKKASVVVQSTQNIEEVLKIVGVIGSYIKELKFFNTICRPTRRKQKEIQELAKNNQLIIVIGSKTSANTRRLYEISHSLNKNSHWVHSKKELKPKWFKLIKSVGVAAGASTPDSTTKETIKQIRKYS